MLSPLRNRFGIPGVISVIALVFAMLGGAYAASNDGGKATASAKGKRGPRGPKGATGPAGPAGPAGPQGPAGAKGDTGANGSPGEKGKDGTNGAPGAPGAPGEDGKSVEILEEPDGTGAVCPGTGGVVYEIEESGNESQICNGKEGSPWTAGGTLPPGSTETGGWAFSGPNSGEVVFTSVSFPIPLGLPLTGAHVHFVTESGGVTACPGNVNEPQALPGHLCVYEGARVRAEVPRIEEPTLPEQNGAARTGAALAFETTGANALGGGSFAVTGCSAALPVGDPNKCP